MRILAYAVGLTLAWAAAATTIDRFDEAVASIASELPK